jgi:hypothetical protein
MSIKLNDKYFRQIYNEIHDDIQYTVYRPLDYPIILYSIDNNIPIASLHFRCQDSIYQNYQKGNRGKSIITNDNIQSCDFLAITNMDNQEFELVISNLTDIGYINFNIFKTDRKTITINPNGLNEINELRPYESYPVQCDQHTNDVLLLKSNNNIIEDDPIDNDNVELSTTYYISIVPQIDKPQLVSLFNNTEWRCTDLICLKSSIQKDISNKSNDKLRKTNIKLYNHEFNRFNTCFNFNYSVDSSLMKPNYNRINILQDAFLSNRKMYVNYVSTGLDYDYTKQSAPCKIGLVINTVLEFNQDIIDWIPISKEYIREILNNNLHYKIRSYYTDKCIICSDIKRPIDVIYYQCGHMACHYECGKTLIRCPVCKSFISARCPIQVVEGPDNILIKHNINNEIVSVNN